MILSRGLSTTREYILTSLFLVGITQQVSMDFVFVRGRPFQKTVITNCELKFQNSYQML